MSFSLLALIILGLLGIYVIALFISVYNKLTVLKNGYHNAFAQIDVILTRRYELIPNLVEVAKRYMDHEHDTLVNVTRARNQASNSLNEAKQNLTDENLLNVMSKAEGSLDSALARLMVVVEDYPDLKANEEMARLSEELSNTENLVAAHRQTYNECIKDFNNALQIFPNNLIASFMSRFKPAAWLPIDDVAKREAPKVTF